MHSRVRKKKVLTIAYNCCCGICGKKIEDNPTIDHIIPKSLGGKSTFDNLQLAHYECNQNKRSEYIKPKIFIKLSVKKAILNDVLCGKHYEH